MYYKFTIQTVTVDLVSSSGCWWSTGGKCLLGLGGIFVVAVPEVATGASWQQG